VKGYSRDQSRDYNSFTAYNRLVDAAHPESDAARNFAGLVNDWANNKTQIRRQLIAWQNNNADLVPLLQSNALLQEDVPLAQDVSALAAGGLQALEYLESGRPAPQNWVSEQTSLLDRAAKPRAELLIMIVPSIRKLVDMAAQVKP